VQKGGKQGSLAAKGGRGAPNQGSVVIAKRDAGKCGGKGEHLKSGTSRCGCVSLELCVDVLIHALVKQPEKNCSEGGRGVAHLKVGWTPLAKRQQCHQRACQPHTDRQASTASV